MVAAAIQTPNMQKRISREDLWNTSTRRKIGFVGTLTKPTGAGVTSIDIPRVGICTSINLAISLTIAGTLSAPNALGLASCIRRVVVKLNNGQNLIDISGAGYHYLLRETLYNGIERMSYTDARLAVTTGAKVLDMVLPISMNNRDMLGLLMLQNNDTVLTVSVEWENDATVATGATISLATADVHYEYFEVPKNPQARPTFNIIQQILEDQISIPASGEYVHQIQRGGVLGGMYYLYPATFTGLKFILQRSNVVEDHTVKSLRMEFNKNYGRDITLAGALTGINNRAFLDFLSTDGLGRYGSIRDVVNTEDLTNIESRIQAVAAGTLYAVRNQFVQLGRAS